MISAGDLHVVIDLRGPDAYILKRSAEVTQHIERRIQRGLCHRNPNLISKLASAIAAMSRLPMSTLSLIMIRRR
jgi:hypothetical protein